MKSTRQFTKRHPQSPLMAHGASPTSVTSATSPGTVANGFSAAAAALNGQTTSATTGGMVAPSALHANPLESSVTVQSSTSPLHKHRSNISSAVSDFQSKGEHTQYEPTAHVQNQSSSHGPSEQAYSPHSHEHQLNQHNHPHAFPSHHSSHHGQQPHLQLQHSHGHNHDYGHNHSHHGHDHHHDHHHDHSHDHHDNHHHDDHHHHDHHHTYPAVFIPPLPSWSEIFGSLAPMQKTVFTWFSVHLLIGLCVWWAGTSRDSLAIVGFSYLVIYDAFGVLNIFVSDIVRTHPSFTSSNTKRPYGARRYEIVFAMATTVFLLFATMYTTKESLEHLLLEEAEGDHHTETGLGFFGFILLCVAMGSTFLSSVSLKNHENLVRHLRRSPPTVHGFSYNVVNPARGSALNIVLSNVYSFSIVACGACVLLFHVLGLASPFMDKVMAFGESAVMLYLALPTATALSKLLLQTTPDLVRAGIENRLSEIRQDQNIISIDRVHFWQNTYGKCVGTLEVQIRPDADEQATLQYIYQKLEGLTSSDDGQDTYIPSELTVSILKQ